MSSHSKANRTLELARRAGVLRSRDLIRHGIERQYLAILTRRGKLHRAGRGLYVPADANLTENHSLAEATKRVPNGVVCLLSALRFHNLGTQLPSEVWMAIDRKAWAPKMNGIRLRVVRFSGSALTSGIERHKVGGVTVKVFSPAKTVADCFKFRNKIGLDVALEALRECWRGRRATMDEIANYARICRVANIMRPYMESLV